jgi:cytochrome c oxidase subunit 2
MFMVVLVVTGVAFVLVEGILIYFLLRCRHHQGQKAAYIHGDRRIEIAWTVIPGVMLFGLAVYQYGAWIGAKLDLPAESEALTVSLSSNQFEWEATYPGVDGVLATADDIKAPINVLHFPVNRPVLIRLESVDVLHSFWLPALRVKQDAVPGRQVSLWFEATQPGEYEVACAELCGLGHYRMRAIVTVESQAEFDAWMADIAARQASQ